MNGAVEVRVQSVETHSPEDKRLLTLARLLDQLPDNPDWPTDGAAQLFSTANITVVVNEANLLTFTTTATDVDFPAQTLAFSLDPGAPSGARWSARTN